MNSPGKSLISALLAAVCFLAAPAAPAENTNVGIFDIGPDGDEWYYNLRCSAERRLILRQVKKEDKVCFLGKDQKEQCLHHIRRLREAAQQACEATE